MRSTAQGISTEASSSLPEVLDVDNGSPKKLQYPATTNLQSILRDPIQFVPATILTVKDESRMSLVLESTSYKKRRFADVELSGPEKSKSNHIPDCSYQNPNQKTIQVPQKVQPSSTWNRQIFKASSSTGFENRGMNCYRNCLVQALLHAPKFINWLILHHESCATRMCVACAFRDLGRKYWDNSSDRAGVHRLLINLQSCLKVTNAFRSFGFQWSRQHDAPEFYGNLVSAMLEKAPSSSKVVKGLLGHSLAITMTCSKCGKETHSKTTGNEDFILSVKYQKAMSLDKLLEQVTFGKSIVQGRRCESCKEVSDTPRLERLLTAPDILVIQLHRFSEGKGMFGRHVKDQNPIPFSEHLDLSHFTDGKTSLRYSLLSVVQHLGSRESGHYRTIARGPEGRWEELDDESVQRTTLHSALNPNRPWTPYVLFYAKNEDSKQVSKSNDMTAQSWEVNGLHDRHNAWNGGSSASGRKRERPARKDWNGQKKFRGNRNAHHHRRGR